MNLKLGAAIVPATIEVWKTLAQTIGPLVAPDGNGVTEYRKNHISVVPLILQVLPS